MQNTLLCLFFLLGTHLQQAFGGEGACICSAMSRRSYPQPQLPAPSFHFLPVQILGRAAHDKAQVAESLMTKQEIQTENAQLSFNHIPIYGSSFFLSLPPSFHLSSASCVLVSVSLCLYPVLYLSQSDQPSISGKISKHFNNTNSTVCASPQASSLPLPDRLNSLFLPLSFSFPSFLLSSFFLPPSLHFFLKILV